MNTNQKISWFSPQAFCVVFLFFYWLSLAIVGPGGLPPSARTPSECQSEERMFTGV